MSVVYDFDKLLAVGYCGFFAYELDHTTPAYVAEACSVEACRRKRERMSAPGYVPTLLGPPLKSDSGCVTPPKVDVLEYASVISGELRLSDCVTESPFLNFGDFVIDQSEYEECAETYDEWHQYAYQGLPPTYSSRDIGIGDKPQIGPMRTSQVRREEVLLNETHVIAATLDRCRETRPPIASNVPIRVVKTITLTEATAEIPSVVAVNLTDPSHPFTSRGEISETLTPWIELFKECVVVSYNVNVQCLNHHRDPVVLFGATSMEVPKRVEDSLAIRNAKGTYTKLIRGNGSGMMYLKGSHYKRFGKHPGKRQTVVFGGSSPVDELFATLGYMCLQDSAGRGALFMITIDYVVDFAVSCGNSQFRSGLAKTQLLPRSPEADYDVDYPPLPAVATTDYTMDVQSQSESNDDSYEEV